MNIEENIKLGVLLDIYGELLSLKQKNMLSSYIYSDMSLSEIAENNDITRSAVLDSISTAKKKLLGYEQKLKLYEIKCRLNYAVKQDDQTCKNEITKLLEEI